MPTATYTALATTVLSASASDVTFGNIGNGYRDLIVIARVDGSVTTELFIRFNGDATTSYYSTRMQGNGTTEGYNTHVGPAMRLVGNGDIMTDNTFSATIQLNDYSTTDKHKPVLSRTGSSNGIDACVGIWTNINPITSVTLIPNSGTFESGSTFSLYGIGA